MKHLYLILILIALIGLISGCSFQPTQVWNSSIEANGIKVSTLTNAAGAVGSLTWSGVEFIDSSDHGRLLQSSMFYHDRYGNLLNPTEAGSSADGTMDNSSGSILMGLYTSGLNLFSTVNPTYWAPIIYGSSNSGDLISKHVTLGYKGYSNVIQYTVQFDIPTSRSTGWIEALTGYMPSNFNRYYSYQKGSLLEIFTNSVVPAATITSTQDNGFSLAAVSLDSGTVVTNFGKDFFTASTPCSKWNIVSYQDINQDKYEFHMLLVIGTLSDVVSTLKGLNL